MSLTRLAFAALSLALFQGCLEQPTGPSVRDPARNEVSVSAFTVGAKIYGFDAKLTADVTLTADWKHYGLVFPTNVTSAQGITSGISPLTMLGGAVKTRYTGPSTLPKIKWTNGTPTGTASTTDGLQVTKAGQGWEFTVPAGTTPMELLIYYSLSNASASFSANFSGGGGYGSLTAMGGSLFEGIFTYRFKAATAGQTLKVDVSLGSVNTGGNLGLMAIVYRPYANMPPAGYMNFHIYNPADGNIAWPGPWEFPAGTPLNFGIDGDTRDPDGCIGYVIYRNWVKWKELPPNTVQISINEPVGQFTYMVEAVDGFGKGDGGGVINGLTSTYEKTYSSVWDLPDNNSGGMNFPFNIAPENPNALVRDYQVTIEMFHTWDADVSIQLLNPLGTNTGFLSNQNGGSGDDYWNTVFWPGATQNIVAGSPRYTGTYQPEYLLNGSPEQIIGTKASGGWIVKFVDHAAGDAGLIEKVKLKMTIW
jgi:subtilisin-like proprotein convertase family protein